MIEQNSIRRRPKKRVVEAERVLLSKNDMVSALSTVISKYVELYGVNKEVSYYTISIHDKVVVIEDSLIIDFRLVPRYWTQQSYVNDWDHPYIMVQELTHNDLFKFNFTAFRKYFTYEHIGLDFYYFHGLHYYRKEIDNIDAVAKALPELRLENRLQDYPGQLHHFVILRMESRTGDICYTVGETTNKVHSFILKLCKELESCSTSLRVYGVSCLPHFKETYSFIDALLSWKGERKQWRLENKFSYYYEDRLIKNDSDIERVMKEIIQAAYSGFYNNCEFGNYTKPINKWKSEELVFNITKKLFKEYQVIYQYRPYYLSTDYGQMSYDVYICGLKVAIEYQGKQHFEPVDFFGGPESFKKQQERDQLKVQRSNENGVKLVFINYWENISPELIRKRVEE